MADSQIISEWVAKADEDFQFAERDLRDEDTFFALLCFHFYQAAEKYLKALCLVFHLPLKKTHDLIELLEMCIQKYPACEELRPDITFLKPFYIETRYPVAYPIGNTKEEASSAYKSANRIRTFVKSTIQRSSSLDST